MQEEIKNIPVESGKKGSQTGNVPRADIELGSLCELVAQNWQKSKWLTLQWLPVAEFVNSVALYNALLTDKTVQGSGRPKLTDDLRDLDKQIDSSIEYIKGYLSDKYGKKKAPAAYAGFGIVRQGTVFIIPKDRTSRKKSLAQMQKGIALEGFTKNTYGKAYWDDIKQKFDDFVAQAIQTDSGVSIKTGNKNVLKTVLKKALNAIVLATKANFPDTWKAVLRDWGFQKEKY